MATDSSNVAVAVTGVVSVAPTGTAAPTTASSALNVAFKDLGYISEDGVTETRDRSTNEIKAWQNGDTVREVITDASLSYSFTMLETKKETVELYYGSAVTDATGVLTVVPSATGGRKAFVIDAVDGSNLIRTYIPQGEVTEVGDVVFVNGEAIGYEVTIRAYPDSTISGAAKKFYSDLIVP